MAGKVTSTAPVVAVSTKYPVPVTAVKSTVLGVVSQDTTPVPPKPVAVPLFEIVTPAGILIVSPLSPKVVVPHAVHGLILLTFISLIIIETYILLLLYQNRLNHQYLLVQQLRLHHHQY